MGVRTREDAKKSSIEPKIVHTKPQMGNKVKNTLQDVADIYAAPASSDEDESIHQTNTTSQVALRISARTKFSPPEAVEVTSRQHPKASTFTMPDPFNVDEIGLSQPRKRRKMAYTYGTKHTCSLEDNVKSRPKEGFASPAALLEVRPSATDVRFKVPEVAGTCESATRKTRNRSAQLSKEPTSRPTFKMPSALEMTDIDSSASSIAESLSDVPALSQDPARQQLDSDTLHSPCTSVDDIFDLHEHQVTGCDDSDDGLDSVPFTRCKFCRARVELSLYEDYARKHNMRGTRQHQKFCLLHRQKSAQKIWHDQCYPSIDWQDLEHGERISNHIPHLRNIIRGKAPSFYRSRLEAVVGDGAASRKAVNYYVKVAIVEVAFQGYYGPRGARVMGDVLTQKMLKELETQQKVDKVAGMVSVGGYVSTVLVPELMVALVKEDMGVQTSKEARRILEESTNVGVALNGDDDDIIVRTEDDDI